MENFQNKTILIVGASSGIGARLAEDLAEQGARLILCARSKDKLNELSSKLPGAGHLVYELDASDEDDTKSFLKDLKSEKMTLDGVVFAAGQHSVVPLRVAKPDNFKEIMASNVYSVTNIMPKLLRILNEGSSVVLIGSAATVRAGSAVSPYVAAKAALEGLCRSWALELAPKKIRVNLVAPGVVMTKMTEQFFVNLGEEAVAEIKGRHPLGLGAPSDVSEMIGFLVSDKSKWLTGQTIFIDGGFSISDH